MILGQREVPLGARLPRVCVLYALFLLISFFGWLLEVLFFFFLGHGFTDRGFLSLPLCTVYGVGVIAIDLLLGLPTRMRIFSLPITARSRRGRLARLLLYVFLSAVICTVCELALGAFLHLVFGVFLWDYRGVPFHLGAYICLPYALIWGILAYVFMRYAFLFWLRLIERMQRKTFFAVFLPISILLILDIAMNCTYAVRHHAHMALW